MDGEDSALWCCANVCILGALLAGTYYGTCGTFTCSIDGLERQGLMAHGEGILLLLIRRYTLFGADFLNLTHVSSYSETYGELNLIFKYVSDNFICGPAMTLSISLILFSLSSQTDVFISVKKHA